MLLLMLLASCTMSTHTQVENVSHKQKLLHAYNNEPVVGKLLLKEVSIQKVKLNGSAFYFVHEEAKLD